MAKSRNGRLSGKRIRWEPWHSAIARGQEIVIRVTRSFGGKIFGGRECFASRFPRIEPSSGRFSRGRKLKVGTGKWELGSGKSEGKGKLGRKEPARTFFQKKTRADRSPLGRKIMKSAGRENGGRVDRLGSSDVDTLQRPETARHRIATRPTRSRSLSVRLAFRACLGGKLPFSPSSPLPITVCWKTAINSRVSLEADAAAVACGIDKIMIQRSFRRRVGSAVPRRLGALTAFRFLLRQGFGGPAVGPFDAPSIGLKRRHPLGAQLPSFSKSNPRVHSSQRPGLSSKTCGKAFRIRASVRPCGFTRPFSKFQIVRGSSWQARPISLSVNPNSSRHCFNAPARRRLFIARTDYYKQNVRSVNKKRKVRLSIVNGGRIGPL